MKSLPIPQDEQIKAVVDGSIYELLGNYVESPTEVDYRKYLTFDRKALIDYLTTHWQVTEKILQLQLASNATHDVERIFRDGSGYSVASMDHGQKRNVTRFRNPVEAVAEYVLTTNGMY